jgi:hypothetical protein
MDSTSVEALARPIIERVNDKRKLPIGELREALRGQVLFLARV